MKKPILAYEHNAAKIIAGTFRLADAAGLPLSEVLARAQASHLCTTPFDLAQVRFIPEQLTVVPQVLWPRPRSSQLFQYISEFPDDVHLVSDAFTSGRDSLYFCRLCTDREPAVKWLSRMAVPTLLVKQTGADVIIAAPVTAFAA